MAEPSIAIRDLSLNFGAVEVLKNLNLTVADGEFLVLLGSSGCGKSTLLNCIAGLLDVTDGQIFIGGRNVTWEEPSDRGIGMVFQSYALYPQMSVEGNLSFGLKNARVPRSEIAARVARAAKTLQIEPLLKRKPAALSGGQRQRVAIGRALVRDVDVFLFDEPLSNLDAKLRAELRVEIKQLHQTLGNTMIYVTHDQVEAMTLADRIAIMRGGTILQLGNPNEIYNRPNSKYVAEFIGSPTMNFFGGQMSCHGGSPTLLVGGADAHSAERLRLFRRSPSAPGRLVRHSARARFVRRCRRGRTDADCLHDRTRGTAWVRHAGPRPCPRAAHVGADGRPGGCPGRPGPAARDQPGARQHLRQTRRNPHLTFMRT